MLLSGVDIAEFHRNKNKLSTKTSLRLFYLIQLLVTSLNGDKILLSLGIENG